MKPATRAAAIAAALMLFACSRAADPADAASIILGEWEKLEKSMPPVHLVISRHSDGDHARLRLSGVEQVGTVTTNGNHIVLHFANKTDITGEIVSATELTLNLDLPVRTNLRKRVP